MENFEIMEITPEKAKEMLERNFNNRTINYKMVKMYAKQMYENNWDITGQAISFDTDGVLIDGQHRLAAVCLANKPVKMLVATGLRRSLNYDNGKLRSPTESIYMATGKKFNRSIASAAHLAIRIRDNNYSKKVSVDEQYKWIMKHEKTLEELNLLGRISHTASVAAVMVASVSAYENGIPAETIIGWRKVLSEGLYEMPYQQTAVALRNWWMTKFSHSRGAQSSQPMQVKAAQNNLKAYADKKIIKKIVVPENYVWEVK